MYNLPPRYVPLLQSLRGPIDERSYKHFVPTGLRSANSRSKTRTTHQGFVTGCSLVSPDRRNRHNLRNLRMNHRTKNDPIDGTGAVTIRVLYCSMYLRRSSVSG